MSADDVSGLCHAFCQRPYPLQRLIFLASVTVPRQCSSELLWLALRFSRLCYPRMTSITSKFASWYTNAAAFKVEDLFSQKRKAGPRRTVFVNENIADNYRDHRGRVKPEHVYSTNQVITSKYTIITFVPRNLLEQFRRIANMSVIYLIMLNEFASVSILPLLFLLILILKHPASFLASLFSSSSPYFQLFPPAWLSFPSSSS